MKFPTSEGCAWIEGSSSKVVGKLASPTAFEFDGTTYREKKAVIVR